MGKLKSIQPRLASVPQRLARRATHDERHRTQPWRAWYNTAEWRRLRIEVLKRDGWRCRQTNELLIGKAPAPNSPVVDHIKPHRGDRELFFDIDNLQAVTKQWHDSEKQKLERAGIY